MHFSSTLHGQNQPDTSILQLNFLRRTSAGPATFVVKDVKLGRATSIIHVTLVQNDVEEAVAYITQTNCEKETGVSMHTGWSVVPSAPAGRPPEAEKWEEVTDLPFLGFRKATSHVELWMPREDARRELPAGRVDQWMRMRSGERWTNVHLGYLADYFPLLIEFMEPNGKIGKEEGAVRAGAKFWYPTLVLNLEIKKRLPADGCEWLRSVVQMRHVRNGRNDLELVLFDEKGDLVAVSHHVCLVVPVSRNVSERRKDRVNVAGDNSKI